MRFFLYFLKYLGEEIKKCVDPNVWFYGLWSVYTSDI